MICRILHLLSATPPTALAVVFDINKELLLGGAGCAFLLVVAPPLLLVGQEDDVTATIALLTPNAGIDAGQG